MRFGSQKLAVGYALVLVLCLFPFFSASGALAVGILFSLLGWRLPSFSRYASFMLQASIVLMGFGMQVAEVLEASQTGLISTAVSVVLVMAAGYVLARCLKVEGTTGLLIASGTAICGGSAIAAVAPLVRARNEQTSFALVVVFVLNALALFLFPWLGHLFQLSETSFGWWAALAIHDTSSVVGAGAVYGPQALEVATTTKLVRALWILPLSLVLSLVYGRGEKGRFSVPWFIFLFAGSIGMVWLFPSAAPVYSVLGALGKRGMVMALFLIGSGLSFKEARKAGWRSFAMGILLWLLVGSVALLVLKYSAV